jgi:glycosyltransferase involved in cell wall biosynthesis
MRQPLVSVIIPAYNAEPFIGRTLESIMAQTYLNLEILVVDDGSQDSTPAIIREYMKMDARIQLLQQDNGGVASARNIGIEQSKGEFIAPIDADDIAFPMNIECQVRCLLKEPESVGVSYVWSIDIDEKDIPSGIFRASRIAGGVYATLLCHNFLGNASSTLIRRRCFELVGLYDTQFKDNSSQGCEDWDLYLRIAQHYEFQVVPRFLLGYRKLPNSMSSNVDSMVKWHNLVLKRAAQRRCGIPFVLYNISRSNLYMYLALQTYSANNPRGTLSLLSQALKADCITPFLRYSFYKLTCISILRLTTHSFRTHLKHKKQCTKLSYSGQARQAHKQCNIEDIQGAKINIRSKIIIWNMFHIVVSGIARFGNYQKLVHHGSN